MSQWPPGKTNLSGFGLEYVAQIGSGHYGTVTLVRETSTGRSLVAKSVPLGGLKPKEQENAHQEVCLLQALRHPLIVTYHNSFLVDGMHTLVILMEHCVGGDLRCLIVERQACMEWLPEDQVMTWFAQILLALQYIHSERVLHRDLKTSNIFLVEASPTSVLKLGDFGISRVLEGTSDAAMSTVGTPYYMSPEVCRNDPYNWKSDVWALGCVLYEICALKRAFESSSLAGLIYRIVNDRHDQIPDHYSPALNDLISQLLAKSADSRPALSDLSVTSYVKQYLQKQAVLAMPPEAAFLAESLASEDEARSVRMAAEASAEMRQLETWARQVLEPLRPVMGAHFISLDVRQSGFLPVTDFQGVLVELLPEITPAQLNILVHMAEKNEQGEIDYIKFADAYSGPVLPPAPMPPHRDQTLALETVQSIQSDAFLESEWGSVLEPATFGETANWGSGFGTCSSQDFATANS